MDPESPHKLQNPLLVGAGTLRTGEERVPSHLLGAGNGAGPDPAQGVPLLGGHLASLMDALEEHLMDPSPPSQGGLNSMMMAAGTHYGTSTSTGAEAGGRTSTIISGPTSGLTTPKCQKGGGLN